jgi:nucleotide-binding universal stress UspA family protein
MTENKTSGRFQRILVGYDGSQESEKAIQVGLSFSNTFDSRLEILAVIQPGEPAASVSSHKGLDHARKHYELALSKIVEAANGHGGNVETSVVVGHPADQLIQRAEQSHSDLVVVGRRGTSRFENLDMGSVSEHVLAHAPCPVLVTR